MAESQEITAVSEVVVLAMTIDDHKATCPDATNAVKWATSPEIVKTSLYLKKSAISSATILEAPTEGT